ncbi:hypothetical protein MMC27_008797 [Xylographa pallens]|nr:hypothetical protein [Xylographa pallens]
MTLNPASNDINEFLAARRGSSSRGRRQSEKFKRHEEVDAHRPDSRKLESRTDLNVTIRRPLVKRTLNRYKYLVKAFDNFGIKVLETAKGHMIRSYFMQDSHKPSVRLINQFLHFLADTRRGRINHAISLSTLEKYLRYSWGAISYYSLSSFDHAAKDQHKFHLFNVLAREQHLSRQMKAKPIIYQQDCKVLIEVLFTPRYLATFNNSIEVLQLFLFLNLSTDTASRISELLPWDPKGGKDKLRSI